MKGLTAERLREVLDYDPETGVFRWRAARGPHKAGSIAGCYSHSEGYLQIRVDYKIYYAHRLAWLYVHGEWPEGDIDHRNRLRTDNRLCNLRPATRSQNMKNGSLRRNNKLRIRGVHRARSGSYIAQIKIMGRQTYLGSFYTAEAAAEAYRVAAQEHHGEFYGEI